jgi:hypothetical protein
MKQPLLALLIILTAVFGARGQIASNAENRSHRKTAESITQIESENESYFAARAIAALKRLEKDVLLYRSLAEFESSGKLARVPLATFQSDLQEVSAEVETVLPRLPEDRLKSSISNALRSYQDGAFWWAKIHQPRVVSAASLISTEVNRTPFDATYLATIPYTVAVNWRQASKYLIRAEKIISGTQDRSFTPP